MRFLDDSSTSRAMNEKFRDICMSKTRPPLYDFHNPISPCLLKFLLQALWFGVSFCLIAPLPTLSLLHFTSPPYDLCNSFLLHLTLCFWQNREYMAQSQLSLKSYDVSSVKKQFRLIQCLYMTMCESWCDDGSLPISRGPPVFFRCDLLRRWHAAGRCWEVVTISPLP